jgi:hypothetical protein
MATSQIKVFLIQPESPRPEKLIYSESEDDAKNHAGSMLAQRANPGDKVPLLNDDPYLKNGTKFTEIEVEILKEKSQSETIHCKFKDKEYFLTKNIPQIV